MTSFDKTQSVWMCVCVCVEEKKNVCITVEVILEMDDLGAVVQLTS